MNDFPKPTVLMIMDGYGETSQIKGNAVLAANKPNLDRIFQRYPHTTLGASGSDVGLPKGQMGNSEVGHLNIGAGRIVYQELTKITKAIEDGEFFQNQALIDAMAYSVRNNSSLHLMGLVSDGGVHSHIDHLLALLNMAKEKGIGKVFIHCFLDGRDVPPRSGVEFLNQLETHMLQIGLGTISTVSGRYYAMDRDNRWDRVEKAYDAITLGEGEFANDPVSAVMNAYSREENDEFVLPTFIRGGSTVKDNDAIIMFNFRPDRSRELTRTFVDDNFDSFKRKKVIQGLHYVCLTQYDVAMPHVTVAFLPQSLKNTLGEYLSNLNFKQLRIAETEKYAHVTFFFNGGVEAPNPGEDRILVQSPKVATYDLQPEMSAYIVTEKVLAQIQSDKYDLIILNFANADMVGHSGIFQAAQSAVEALDKCVPQIVDAVLAKGGQLLLTADHGNAEEMLDANGQIQTSHSLNPVPLVYISNHPKPLRNGGVLADLAPTLLDIMGIPAPEEMTGRSLV